MTRFLGPGWAIVGFSALMLWAIYRLALISIEALQMSLGPLAWTLLIANTLFMAWSEGYRGFQQAYSPRFAQRVARLSKRNTPVDTLLAPFFAMGYYGAERKRMLTTYLLTAMLVVLIIVFHQIPQPWRGILDAGVVVGLSWGTLATWWHCYLALSGKNATSAIYEA